MSSVKMREPILCDMDGVLVDFVGVYYEHAKKYHKSFYDSLPDRETLKEFYIEHNINTTNQRDADIVEFISKSIVDHPHLLLDPKPYHDAIAGFKYLTLMAARQNREVLICSAHHVSNPTFCTDKAIWLEKHLGKQAVEKMILTRDKTCVRGVILIDDKPTPLGKYTPTWNHVVFDQSYNRNKKETEGKWRMMNWTRKEVDVLLYNIKDLP